MRLLGGLLLWSLLGLISLILLFARGILVEKRSQYLILPIFNLLIKGFLLYFVRVLGNYAFEIAFFNLKALFLQMILVGVFPVLEV